MPLTKVKWPLTARCLSNCFSRVATARLQYKCAVAGAAKYLTQALRFLPVSATAKFATVDPAHYAFDPLPLESLAHADEDFEIPAAGTQRIYVPWDGNFLYSRLREEDGHEFLSVIDREKRIVVGSLIVQRSDDEGLTVIDGMPSRVYASGRFWVSLLRYAMKRGAAYVSVRLYHNNPTHSAALKIITRRIPGLMIRSQLVLAVLALDRRLDFAYDCSAWASTDRLVIGF